MEPTSRRTFLAASTAAAFPAPSASEPFNFRGYLGWITDLATHADTNAGWPSMRLDAALMRDYHETFGLMREWKLQDLCIWGLYVSRSWPLDINSSVTPERGKLIEKLIGGAHAHNLRVVSGLGIYSWGFDQILQANPHLMKGNKSAMCGSEDESWQWMRKVIDFVFTRFPIDGVSMQSADQGRCPCEKCKRYSETEYHARLNIRCAEYIHSKYPNKLVAVSGWGMRFHDPAALPHIVELSKRIDYLIDVRDSSRQNDPALRRRMIESLKCSFGTLGGPQVEPPQHWPRDRWFLPTIESVGEHLRQLHAEGGRACEWFYHILANPGDEISTWVAAKVLANPATPWRTHLNTSLERLYRVTKTSHRDALAEAFLAAERAYIRHIPNFCGTISMEPLLSNNPGPPVYLTRRLNAHQRKQYAAGLQAARAQFVKIAPDIPERNRLQFILRSIDNTLKDAASV
ncbi:MAG: hypothetical protein IT168_11790 [Bryobacterales bacterium]|nr:hypothetical protein [Bryobacterales bacterium]